MVHHPHFFSLVCCLVFLSHSLSLLRFVHASTFFALNIFESLSLIFVSLLHLFLHLFLVLLSGGTRICTCGLYCIFWPKINSPKSRFTTCALMKPCECKLKNDVCPVACLLGFPQVQRPNCFCWALREVLSIILNELCNWDYKSKSAKMDLESDGITSGPFR